MTGFLLGLSTGTVCLGYCSPILVPYLLGRGGDLRRNFLSVARFCAGRLFGYLLFGFLAWLVHGFFTGNNGFRMVLFGLADIILAVLLMFFGFTATKSFCAAEKASGFLSRIGMGLAPVHQLDFVAWMPLVFGFLTGINLCPPFLLAFTEAMATKSLAGSVGYFFMFFLGTTLYLLPLPFLGVMRQKTVFATVGKYTAVIAGVFYVYQGIVMLIGGILG
ncbi:MAG TPA: sulfite exporter TauE/SafE family protein [Bacillota bacterium]